MSKIKYFAADFENTVPDIEYSKDIDNKKVKKMKNQEIREFETRVWAAGITSVDKPEKDLFTTNNIKDFFDYLFNSKKVPDNSIIYFHNLKYDAGFIEAYLLSIGYHVNPTSNPSMMACNTFNLIIGTGKIYYQITVKTGKFKTLIFRDSFKLLPLSLDKLTKDLNIKHKKLTGTIDYCKDRPEGYQMTDEEKRYFENDIMGLAECLNEVNKEFGLLKYITIGAACLKEYKLMNNNFKDLFPSLEKKTDEFCRKAYKGGWCYCKKPSKEYKNIIGYVADVSSLYPSCQHSLFVDNKDIHMLPYGNPIGIETGHENISKFMKKHPEAGGFIKLHARYNLKEKSLPFIKFSDIQLDYDADFYNDENEYSVNCEGATLWLTLVDFKLFTDIYDVQDVEFIEAIFFKLKSKMFDEYIDKFNEIKEQATIENNKTKRLISKLMNNNLYGKFGTNPDATTYTPELDENGIVRYDCDFANRSAVYIPVAAYITAYARDKIVRDAIRNFGDGCETFGFAYADTDSIHYISKNGELPNVLIDNVEMGKYKIEAQFSNAKYIRKKVYIEYITKENNETIEPYWSIKWAGASDGVKDRMLYEIGIDKKLTLNDDVVIDRKKTIDEFMSDFKIGYKQNGHLSTKTVKNGRILYRTVKQIRKEHIIQTPNDL